MFNLYVKKYKNGYAVEIGYEDEEITIYKTREELVADFGNQLARAEAMEAEEKARREAKKSE